MTPLAELIELREGRRYTSHTTRNLYDGSVK